MFLLQNGITESMQFLNRLACGICATKRPAAFLLANQHVPRSQKHLSLILILCCLMSQPHHLILNQHKKCVTLFCSSSASAMSQYCLPHTTWQKLLICVIAY